MKRFYVSRGFGVLVAVLAMHAAVVQADLFIDFANAATPATPAAGYINVDLANSPAAVATLTTYDWLPTTTYGANTMKITTTSTGGGLVVGNLRSINRTFAPATPGNTTEVTRDWIAVVQSAASAVDPTLTVLVGGFLPNQLLQWTSFHHDGGTNGNQTGLFDYTLQGVAGVYDISNEITSTAVLIANINAGEFGYTSGLAGNQTFVPGTGTTGTVTPASAVEAFATLSQSMQADANGFVTFSMSPKIGNTANVQNLSFGVFNGFSITAIPEPTTILPLGLFGMALFGRRRR